ncbi:MAG: HD domain-containing protein [Candidatus Dojkabacteria bacterium]|nr:HD domain-containing protein [Candidatus Dojkabacteria bacterium]
MTLKLNLDRDIKELVPQYIFDIAKKLKENNFEAYLVGGSVRDILLEREPLDFDVATNAYPDEIVKIFPKSVPTGAKFGTITVVVPDENGENFNVEVTTYRSEADYFGARWPTKVEFSRTIFEDLKRRDFTINAIAINLQVELNNSKLADHILDQFNGLADLQNKIIRAVGDPLERLSEDGLRSVRACRLASQLGFLIEEKTFDAIKKTLHIVKNISVERFRDEFEKLIYKSSKPSIGIKLLKESGILEIFIPELLEGIGIVQPEFHSDDVFEHSLKTLDLAPDDVKLAALFHDIAKPRCKSVDSCGGIHFYGHDLLGAEMTKQILKRLKFPNAIVEETSRLVRWHMFYYPSSDWRKSKKHKNKHLYGWSDGAIRRLINNVGGEESIDKLIKLRIADASANQKSIFDPSEIMALSNRIAEVRARSTAFKITDLDINGYDIMNHFNLNQGKIIGKVLNYLLKKVLDNPKLNKKDILIKYAGNYLKKIQNVK